MQGLLSQDQMPRLRDNELGREIEVCDWDITPDGRRGAGVGGSKGSVLSFPLPGPLSPTWAACAPLWLAGRWKRGRTSRGGRREKKGDVYAHHCSK